MSITTTPPVPAPASNVVPFSMPWGGAPFPPGCCPPGGMDALMQCYCDIQKTLAFMSQIMVQLMTNDPAVQAAMIAGIEKSGSSVPLIGVTNGSDAQPGQVGEFIVFTANVAYVASRTTTVVSLGVLQPGDWDCDAWATMGTTMNVAAWSLSPVPAGVSNPMGVWDEIVVAGEATTIVSPTARASISVPTLFAFTFILDGTPNTGTLYFTFQARRRR